MRLRRLANIARRSGRSTYARVTPDISDVQCGQRVALIGMAAKSIEACLPRPVSIIHLRRQASGAMKIRVLGCILFGIATTAVAPAAILIGVTNTQELVRFDSAAPGTIIS